MSLELRVYSKTRNKTIYFIRHKISQAQLDDLQTVHNMNDDTVK